MPTARESLLDAALAALSARSWATIRMVDIAATAGVSRQTLYNEFGSKEGLARALARREADVLVAGVERVLSAAADQGGDPGDCFAAATGRLLQEARRNPLVRAVLTGCRGSRVPAAAITRVPVPRSPGARPRRSDLPLTPTEVLAALRTRAAATLERGFPKLDPAELAWASEAAVRVGVSYVMAPLATDEDACLRVARLVRGMLGRGWVGAA
ncbi:TetR family transcriptional regulator [Streptomyces sp. NPDC088354]|uniref:TetR family transcriptional regulator n=1 Tax=unclassified Streptomyces TaxID=2593676 RepID=UPI0029A6CDB6|nr:TetR family transcriptional regulator [Streptomyces sp. MI02-7b]MDX3077699.1 TetR family transcriptional regulator [Streptomyces sp. MI02-7b]